jgi:HK97 family phage major capsid protein
MNVRLQELLTRSAEDETIEDKIYDVLVKAVRSKLVATNVLAIRVSKGSFPGDSIKIDLADRNTMLVHEIAEGAEVPIDYGTISDFTITPKKYGLRPLITKEMMEDGKWDLIQYNLEEAGYQMARKLDSLLLAQIEAGDTASSNTVSGSGAITVANINTAIYNLENNDYSATDFIVSPAIAMDIRNIDTFVEADKAGVTNPSKGLIGRILGMTVWQSSQVTADYAYVIDKDHALVLAEKRPITIERYDDVTRDLSGAVVTARWGVRYLRENACCVITT